VSCAARDNSGRECPTSGTLLVHTKNGAAVRIQSADNHARIFSVSDTKQLIGRKSFAVNDCSSADGSRREFFRRIPATSWGSGERLVKTSVPTRAPQTEMAHDHSKSRIICRADAAAIPPFQAINPTRAKHLACEIVGHANSP